MNDAMRTLLSLVPQRQSDHIDWNALGRTPLGPWFVRMTHTPQQPEWHGEGDVYAHTKLVCERLTGLERFWMLQKEQREALFIAALLHDVAKPQTTRLRDGKLVSPRHGPAGAQIVRKLLWTECGLAGTPRDQRLRETICLLIARHTTPPHALNGENPVRKLRQIAANGELTESFTVEMLCLLAEADILGRIADDTQELLDAVRLCAEQAQESGCLTGPYSFPDAYTQRAYLMGRDISPDVPLYDDTWGEVTMLCALPGTGKDTWIAQHLSGIPAVSLDDIRREMGVLPKDDQGRVVQTCKKRVRELLAAKKPFVFNGTNVTDMMRGKWVELFEQYHARVRLVYLETGWEENLRRNAQRSAAVPESVISGLLDKLIPPERFEAQRVEWHCV